MTQTLNIGGLTFAVRRSPRRKTVGLTVDRAGELVVHAPDGTADGELREWTEKKLLWVHRKLAEKQDLRPQRRPLEFVSGESIFYLGQSYRLKLVDKQPDPIAFDGEWFTLRRRDQSSAHEHFRAWFIQSGLARLEARAQAILPRIGGAAVTVSVGDLGYRWGSCGRNGAVHFNWRLLQLPVRLIDYVVAHELAHRIERRHTRRFWQTLERAMPDCRAREAELGRMGLRYAVLEVGRREEG